MESWRPSERILRVINAFITIAEAVLGATSSAQSATSFEDHLASLGHWVSVRDTC